jgi:1-acyl-sn-glycerol-3-phosphate acyltransferase
MIRSGVDLVPRIEDRPIVRMFKAANVCYARVYHQLEVVTPCQLPKSGPAILICNHTSALDPALIQSACSRVIIWMMAREYYEQPALKWFFNLAQAIPVEREKRDSGATRQALRALESGNILGIFPEGKIETTQELLPFQTGAAMLALKTGVGLYPTYLDGTQRGKSMLEACLLPQRARLAFGLEADLTAFGHPKSDPTMATKVLENAINDLRQDL